MKRNLGLDIVLVAVYAIVSLPSLTGIGFHEWAGVGLFVLFLAHVAVHVDWATDAIGRMTTKRSWSWRGNLALDAAILLAFAVVTISGLGISGSVLAAFGLYADGYYFWDPLHAVAAKALLALLLVHVAAHWRWVARAFRKGGPHE